MIRLLLILLITALCGCHQAYFGTINIGADAPLVESHSIVYDREHALSVDIYRATDTPANAPLILFFYGGTWRYGERAWYRFVGESLADHGFVVMIPDYRTAPDVTFPSFVEDAARAAAFAQSNATRYGADPARMFLIGHSAGGHIAALLATDARWLAAVGMKPRNFRAFIGLAGPYDFLPIWSPRMKQVFPDETNRTETQPIHFVDGDEPPMLLLRGDQDIIVLPRHNEEMAALLKSVGVSVETRTYQGVGHAQIVTALARDRSDLAPTLQDVVDYVKRNIRNLP
ncbi:MAG TPA: alpha/beta hydrolase [Pseudomonadota bacterium]|nr:alpha/beta hydrolase [Rhodanobacteraceae bacterium]MBP9154526.1 alpha/beta hydrolase [Xanthomonadales bacterium]HQW81961.1 alpha/beta hydrolase [Pseudomonadota bacterium]